MEWSLVLASQGIECVIEHLPEAGEWRLTLAPEARSRAQEIIELYVRENRHSRWRRRLPATQLYLHWGVLLWCWLMVVFYWASTSGSPVFLERGQMHEGIARSGEWWRLVTATTLHVDVAHLASNLASGFLLVGLAMGLFGPGLALLGVSLAGAGGNLLAWCWRDHPYHGLGASGVVMGALGLLAAHSLLHWRKQRRPAREWWQGLAGSVFLFILMGTSPDSDVLAHAGGFVCGLVLGALLAIWRPQGRAPGRADSMAGWVAALLIALCWGLALRS